MVNIDGYCATQILLINNLIIKYREGLTTNKMNCRGGFPVKDTNLNNTPGTIRATFNNIDLDVVHVNGQICGFISDPDTSGTRKFHFLNQNGTTTDKLDIDGIKAWYTRPKLQEQHGQSQQPARGQQKQQIQRQQPGYGGRDTEIINYPGIDRRYEGCSAKDINLSLEAIGNQFDNLFFRSKRGLSQELMQKSFHTFLLVCSEGAKNSLVHEQIITKLIAGAIDPRDNAYGPLSAPQNPNNNEDPHRAFVHAILTSGKNCGNGAINYINQNIERTEIINNFGVATFAEHANIVYQDDNLEQTYVNIIDSGNYQDCHRVLEKKPRTGQTLSQQLARQIQQLARANPQWRLTSQQLAQQIQ